jgi:hypothetical protein
MIFGNKPVFWEETCCVLFRFTTPVDSLALSFIVNFCPWGSLSVFNREFQHSHVCTSLRSLVILAGI